MRWLCFTPLFGLLCACNVASVREAPDTIVYNECQSSSDCGLQGVCVDVHSASHSGQQCRSMSGTFQNVLFEVTPPADNSPVAGVQYLIPIKDLDPGVSTSLVLEPISQVVGIVTAPERKCPLLFESEPGRTLAVTADSSLPAKVSLIPSSSELGVYSPRAVEQTYLVNNLYWALSVNVPPGKYDIYVEPKPQPAGACLVPPQLIRGNMITSGNMRLNIPLPVPSMFEFHVTGNTALNGWMVDMLEPTSGRVISTRAPLTLVEGSKSDYVANLAYSAVTEGTTTPPQQEQLLRLSPPANAPETDALPTVILARSALALFDAGRGTLSSFTSLPTPIHVIGQVTFGETPTPVPATVTLVANSISGIAPGVLASLVRTVNVGADGQFDVHLLPGKYTVSTVPQSPLDPTRQDQLTLAADSREWIVPSSPLEQGGKTIDLSNSLGITGSVVDVAQHYVATAQVQAVASPQSIRYDALQETLGGTAAVPHPAFVPRATGGEVGSDGSFALKADPGTFDISVRPNDDTGFAWLVAPNVLVSRLGSAAHFPGLTLPLPVSYSGTVTVGGADGASTPIPSALIRAYIYLKDGDYIADSTHANSVVQVAETRADKLGAFEILIPAELNRLQVR